MKRSIKIFGFIFLLLSVNGTVQAQQKNEDSENSPHHRVSLILSHAHIPAANEANGSKRIFIAASLGLNYEWWFNNKWAVGLHNDITMQSFNVERKSSEEIIAREFPILTTLVVVCKPVKGWSFFTGPGREFEKNESFNVVKTGIEYGIELPKTWEIGFGLEYDVKINGYNSLLVGIGISKNLWRGNNTTIRPGLKMPRMHHRVHLFLFISRKNIAPAYLQQ